MRLEMRRIKCDRRGTERNAWMDHFDSKTFHTFLGFTYLIREWISESQGALEGVRLLLPPTSFALVVFPLTRSKWEMNCHANPNLYSANLTDARSGSSRYFFTTHSVAFAVHLQAFSRKCFALNVMYDVVKLAVTFCGLLPIIPVLHFPSRKLPNRLK